MSHAIRSTFSLLLLVFTLTGCALFEERKGPESFYGPREQVFAATFEEVWRAINLVLQPYPLRVSNMDLGTLETDSLRGNRVFSVPYKANAPQSGEVYRLIIKVVRGEKATKVIVTKDVQLQVDFFSEPKALPSDGMEEKTILYRVGREITIERALAKAQKRQNQAP